MSEEQERKYTLKEAAQIFMRCAEDWAEKYWSVDNPNNDACKLFELVEGVESYREELRKYEPISPVEDSET